MYCIPSEADVARIENNFKYHPPYGDQRERYETIRDYAKGFAHLLVQNCTTSRELSIALTHLEETVMWANAAIARNEPIPTVTAVGKK